MAVEKVESGLMALSADRIWRQFATGLCFTVFGLGGVLIAILMLPALYLIPSEDRREHFAKGAIHHTFRLFVKLMTSLGVMSYQIDDIDQLRRPGQLIIANHPTLIDIVLLISFIPRADCVVKSSLLHNPFTLGPIRASRYIANNDPEAVVEAAKASIDRGNSLIIFPEGTRTAPGAGLSLQRGAANIAIRTANKLRPVIIKCQPLTLTKQTKWYQVPGRKFHMSFRVKDPLEVTPYLERSPTLSSRELTADIAEYLTREINTHD